jgi:hypothetical protein
MSARLSKLMYLSNNGESVPKNRGPLQGSTDGYKILVSLTLSDTPLSPISIRNNMVLIPLCHLILELFTKNLIVNG